MTGKEFLIRVSNGETDVLQELLSILEKTGSDYCLIGGIAVNAHAEPRLVETFPDIESKLPTAIRKALE